MEHLARPTCLWTAWPGVIEINTGIRGVLQLLMATNSRGSVQRLGLHVPYVAHRDTSPLNTSGWPHSRGVNRFCCTLCLTRHVCWLFYGIDDAWPYWIMRAIFCSWVSSRLRIRQSLLASGGGLPSFLPILVRVRASPMWNLERLGRLCLVGCSLFGYQQEVVWGVFRF